MHIQIDWECDVRRVLVTTNKNEINARGIEFLTQINGFRMKIYCEASPAAPIVIQMLAKETEDRIHISLWKSFCHAIHACLLFNTNARCETEMPVFGSEM